MQRIVLLGLAAAIIVAAQGSSTATDPPLTAKVRWRDYSRAAFYSPSLVMASAVPAAFDQWSNDPSEFGQGWDAFGERAARRAAQYELQVALYHASAAVVGTPATYQRCKCSGPWRRIRWAMSRTFVTKTGSGRVIPNLPLLGATYGGAMIATNWYPDRYSAVKDGTRIANYQVGASMGFNILQEFGPEVKRFLRRKKR